MTRALIAEDEALLRDSLHRLLLDAWPELEEVVQCEDGAGRVRTVAVGVEQDGIEGERKRERQRGNVGAHDGIAYRAQAHQLGITR